LESSLLPFSTYLVINKLFTARIIFDLVDILKKRYFPNPQKITEITINDWSDFIGCMDAESDLSKNYKTYLTL
jgi:hypothetical protein